MSPDTFYHIYNHANGFENLFLSDENHHYFLRQWAKYIEPIAGTYAYCLMPNHIHFLIKIRPENDVTDNLGFSKDAPFGRFETFQKVISKQFANLFSSYTQAFNKMYGRMGSLFIPNFKKKEILSEEYLAGLITYIHLNPVHHGFCDLAEDWSHSSYHIYLSAKSSKINRNYILSFFGGKDEFVSFHAVEPLFENTDILIDN